MSEFKLEIRQYRFEGKEQCPWAYLEKGELFLGIVYAERLDPSAQRKVTWYVDVLVTLANEESTDVSK